MKRTLRRAWPLLVVSSSLTAGALVIACSGDEPSPADAPDASIGLDSATNYPDTSTADGSTTIDAGADAGEITDGGDLLPEDDGGVTDPDGGFDAGPACDPLTPGAFVTSTCSSARPLVAGGDLTTATYELRSVVVLGPKAFCAGLTKGSFVPYSHRGALEVTASSTTTATFEFLDQYRRAKGGPILQRPTTNRYDVAVAASKNKLTFTAQPCALKPAPAAAAYSTGVNKLKKKTISLILPYGASGSARYTYVEP